MIFAPKPDRPLDELAEEANRRAYVYYEEGRLPKAMESFLVAADRWSRYGRHEGNADAIKKAGLAWGAASRIAKTLASEAIIVAEMLEGH